ncbi:MULTISPECIES: zf-TFIIB domain-containing protein [Micromonospora]|uniref:Zf-TFIIB domain-containing protein n=1 Tax=Micromonospora parva TaxID=1464048 RepID=A0ABW6W1X3_9ACTN|nr:MULTISPECIES: zf-TFIIB domain-containing protein [Micromonospora]MBQ1031142.1 zf-TFIIB domain-containing protein [Micromonospora sp. C97]MDG9675655.1 zf-TFIIB domain-containing protein [Micromonospora sp. DH14]
MSLTCPKCHGEMRQYERSGVVIDQCGECRGIFLDRGELEKLFEAEANWSRQQAGGAPGQPAQQPAGYPPPPPPPAHQPGYGNVPPPPPPAHGYPPQPAYGHPQQHHGYHGHYRQKKRKGFLDEMFG